jgi:hypothetical protein
MQLANSAPVDTVNCPAFSAFAQWLLSFQIQFQIPGNCAGCELSRNVRAMAARCSAAVSS